jgi:hypothetical protein
MLALFNRFVVEPGSSAESANIGILSGEWLCGNGEMRVGVVRSCTFQNRAETKLVLSGSCRNQAIEKRM